jgi:hypothetical protein
MEVKSHGSLNATLNVSQLYSRANNISYRKDFLLITT